MEFSGYPYYIEDEVIGGPISDFGSHYGVKANLTDDRFLKLAYYSCLTANNGMFSHSWFTFDGRGDRKVEFEPWGMEEENGLASAFVDTDLLAIEVRLKEMSMVEFHLDRDDSTTEEGMLPCACTLQPIQKRGEFAVDKAIIEPLELREELMNTPLGMENVIYRAILPSFDFSIDGNTLKSNRRIEGFHILIGFSDDEGDAIGIAKY